MTEKKIPEHYEIAKILADNFTPEKYDDSDFEWCAFQLVQAGYRKQSDVVKEVLKKAEEKMIVVHSNDGLETAYLEDDLYQIAKEMGVEL